MKKYGKPLAILLIVGVTVVALLSAIVQNTTQQIALSELFIKDVSVSGSRVTISGEILSSAKVYKGYHHEIEGDNIYITVLAGLAGAESQSGSFLIEADTEEDITTVFYRDLRNDVQIYSNK